MNKEIIAKSKVQIKNKWFKTKEDELDIALNIIDELEQQCEKQKEVIDKATKNEEEIMYLANKVAITTQNLEIKAVRDRLEEIFKILKEVSE